MSFGIPESLRTHEQFHYWTTVVKRNRKVMNKKNENTNVNEKSCVIKTYVIHLKQLLHYPSFIFW